MDPNQVTQVLLNCQNPDGNIRVMAEKMLGEAEKANYPFFLQMLVAELANNEKQPESRKLAGLVVKNTLTAKDEATRLQKFTRWLQLDPQLRASLKNGVLTTLNSPNRDARGTAATVISKIAVIELPRKVWPELIPGLLKNMQEPIDHLKQSTLETLGYICEEIEPSILAEQSDVILTAVCKFGIKDNNNDVKLAGCIALYNALEFVRSNFEREAERNYIMQVLCEALTSSESEVRKSSMECIGKIASLYYDKLQPYMQKLFQVTLELIRKDEEKVALQAIEFWSSICDEEIYLNEEAEEAAFNKVQPEKVSLNFIKGALKYLIPIITECLTKQDDEPEEDAWNVAMAAGTCVSLISQCVGDEIVQHILPFIQSNINVSDWKFREAATLAFGAILEGPKAIIPQLIQQALPLLLSHMKDPVAYVKDTTAWTIGRICQLHPETVRNVIPQIIQVMLESIGDTPKVVSNVCWTIHNLATSFEDEAKNPTSAFSPFFQVLLENLARVTDRDDAEENNLRASAYEAINVLIQYGAKDTHQIIVNATPVFLNRLEQTFSMQIVSNDDKEEQNERQALLCGVLHSVIQRLHNEVKPFADRMMTLFLQVFSSKNASVQEEALMAVGAIASAVETDFEKYMPHFRQFLTVGLMNYEEYQVCAIAVGIVGDISRALQNKMAPYCNEIITLLLTDLQNPLLHRSVKPPILSCFGDIALAIGGEFVKYLGVVMTVLQQASLTSVDPNDGDLVEYLNRLRESIFDAYTGIIQGLRSDSAADPHFVPHVNNVLSICQTIQADPNRTPEVIRGALGVIGDMAHALGPKIKPQLSQPFINKIISECLSSDDQQSREVAQWVKENLQALK